MLTRHAILRRLLTTPDLANSPRRFDRLRASARAVLDRAVHWPTAVVEGL